MDWKSATLKNDGTVSIPDRWLHLYYYEALNILFRMENSLRVFAYVVLKNHFQEKWADTAVQTTDGDQSTIAATAAKRLAQAKGFGYLGYEINSPLMYLSSGELTQIICADAYWSLFKPYFRGKKEIIRNKLDEIGTVRNALAHFRPLKYDDIELIKQNVKHVFVGIEQCLTEMTQTYLAVPTNTEENWYKVLITLGSPHCKVAILQNSSERWVRLALDYTSAVLRDYGPGEYRTFNVTNLISPAIIGEFPELARHCTFMSETVSYVDVTSDNTPEFEKMTSLVFSKNAVLGHHSVINEQMKKLLLLVENETELIQKDNLARGHLIDAAHVSSIFRKSESRNWWSTTYDNLKTELKEDAPAEYWGAVGRYGTSDFIAGSTKYPWMPSDISKEDLPF